MMMKRVKVIMNYEGDDDSEYKNNKGSDNENEMKSYNEKL